MKIIHQRKKCIGCGACTVVCPKLWKIDQDGRASLVSHEAQYDLETDEGTLEVKEIDCAQDAADVCPSQCILIIKKEKNA